MGNVLPAALLAVLLLSAGFAETGVAADRLVAASKLALSTAETAEGDTLSYDGEYGERLSELASYFDRSDHSIGPLLSDSRFEIYENIGDRFRGSAENKSRSNDEYKEVLAFDKKTERIIDFMDRHSGHLQQAEEQYGISRFVIAAIIGLESDFGTKTGRYNPFNVYVSMYVDGYRGEFARAQLEELLEFTERKGMDVFELKSSYAGAVSSAQFIPYSLNKWFVGDDIHDMKNSILSVGNYLSYFLERTGDLRTAVIRYNPSSLYADTVLELAGKAEEIRESQP